FAARVDEGLDGADWRARRTLIRAIVKEIVVDPEEVKIVYRVLPLTFVEAPCGGQLQLGRRRAFPFPFPSVSLCLCLSASVSLPLPLPLALPLPLTLSPPLTLAPLRLPSQPAARVAPPSSMKRTALAKKGNPSPARASSSGATDRTSAGDRVQSG